MIALAHVYARTLLRRGSTWAIVAAAAVFAMAGVSLDLFGFDGNAAHSIGVVWGTFEVGTVLLAIGARVSGIASGDSQGFRATVVQTAGPTATSLGCILGAGTSAGLACWLGALIVFVFYNLLAPASAEVLRLLLGGMALATEGIVAAAWTGLGSRIAGRVAGAATGAVAFVVARLDVPSAVRACLPAPLPASALGLAMTIVAGLLAALGLVLVGEALPAVGEGTS